MWTDSGRTESRNASGTITKQYFYLGQTSTETNLFYTRDRYNSVRETTSTAGVVESEYQFDPFGNCSTLFATLPADFLFGGYYFHATSRLSLTTFRAYNPMSGKWLNRDFIQEAGGVNLFAYVLNAPTMYIDPLGLDGCYLPTPYNPPGSPPFIPPFYTGGFPYGSIGPGDAPVNPAYIPKGNMNTGSFGGGAGVGEGGDITKGPPPNNSCPRCPYWPPGNKPPVFNPFQLPGGHPYYAPYGGHGITA